MVLGFVFIPGPATILTVARASSSGTRVGLATACGIAVGDLIHTAMAVIGLSAIILASAFAFTLVKYLGAAYLIYLGVRAFFDRAGPGLPGSLVRLTGPVAFRQAIIAEVLNPKTALFFLAFLPQFVTPQNGHVAFQLTVFGVILVLLGLMSTILFALAAGKVGTFMRQHPTVIKWQGKVVGSIYCALGLRLALQER